MSSPSVLFLTNTAEFFLSHRLALAEFLRSQGWRVSIISDDSEAADTLVERGYVVHRTGFSRRSQSLAGELGNLIAIARIIRKTQPDIVHNVALKAVLFGSLAGRAASGARIVNAITGLGISFALDPDAVKLRRILLIRVLRLAIRNRRCYTIVQNPDDLQYLTDQRMILPENAHLIYGSGADPDQYVPRPDAEVSESPSIVLAARLLWSKGVREFVAAADQLAASHPRVRFLIAGKVDSANPDHVPQADLEAFSERPNVQWIGFVDDMPTLLAEAALVVLPSFREGVPRVLIEAAMMGRPIVTTDVPGCRETVVHERTGLLVPPYDGAALAEAIRRLLDDAATRKAYGEAAREFAVEKFSISGVLEQTESVYRQAIADAD